MHYIVISFLGWLSLVLTMSVFAQNDPKAASQSKTYREREIEFINARAGIMDAENASKELIAARIGRKTVQTMKDALKTNEIMLLEADIRIAEANLVAMGGCISIELAKDKNRLETLLLNVATKDSIEREQRSKAAYDLGLTEDVQKAKDSLQILNNDVVTPESAACRVRAQRLLDQNVTADLRQARSRVEALKKEARSKIPEAEKADRHARDTAAKVRTAELTQSVQRVEALMKQASSQVK